MTHDLDFDLQLAIKMADIENEAGITASYFFRLRAKNYNMLSYDGIKAINTISDMGHSVGLHYEPTLCTSDPGIKVQDDIENCMTLLENTSGVEIKYFNIHEPSRTGLDISSLLPAKNRCYNSPFFVDFKYISDSGARWREGCFSEHVGRWDKLLVLTHPFWWYNSTPAENY